MVGVLQGQTGISEGELQNFPLRGAYNNLAVFATEFYVSQMHSSQGLHGLFIDSDDSKLSASKLNGRDESSFEIKADAFQFLTKYLQEPSQLPVGVQFGIMALYQGAFMDETFGSSTASGSAGFEMVRMPLPTYSALKERYVSDKQNIYSKSANDFGNKDFTLSQSALTFEDDRILTGEIMVTDDAANNDYKFAEFEYSTDVRNNYNDIAKYVYQEWGMPATADDEQWYIAMRWPYKIEEYKWGADEVGNKWFETYFANESRDTSLYGTVEDYKSRKILVYSPTTNVAVCLRPAYFLWGNTKDVTAAEGSTFGNDRNASQTIDGDRNPFVDAVVSPDAAYYLGVLGAADWVKESNGGGEEGYTTQYYGLSRIDKEATFDKGGLLRCRQHGRKRRVGSSGCSRLWYDAVI